MPFRFETMDIPDVLRVTPKVFSDGRGMFSELYKASDFRTNGIEGSWAQINRSRSRKNVLRGLHYQLHPKAQDKLICVLSGEVFDVAVDIRKGSPTYGRWVSARLSGDNGNMLYVPSGFAHGFCVLSEDAEIFYYCSEEYAPELERNILWNDPCLAITWPVSTPLLSPKDANGSSLAEAENNFEYKRPLL